MNDYQFSLLNISDLKATTTLGVQRSYVGVELSGYYFDDNNLNNHFFNGALINDCLFQSLEIKHAEIKEATFYGCQFIGCDLTSSDLVYSRFDECLFIKCQFAHGEWIESEFTNCNFTDSIFNHTTVNLNVFRNCSLDKISIGGLKDQSVQFNIFENCRLEEITNLKKCIDRNFGIQGQEKSKTICDSEDLFVKVSRQYFSISLSTPLFILIMSEIVEQMLSMPERSYILRTKYLALICRTYIESENVSPLGIQRLEKMIAQKIQYSNGNNHRLQGLYTELVQLIMIIRLQYGNRIAEIEAKLQSIRGIENSEIQSWEVNFKKSYNENQVALLQDYISKFCDIDAESIKYTVNYGSTNIISELITQAPIYLPAICAAYFSLLKGIDFTSKTVTNVVDAMTKVREYKNKYSTKESVKKDSKQLEVQKQDKKDIRDLQRQQNIMHVITGSFESDFAQRIIRMSCDEKADFVLEMEDYAKLQVTFVNQDKQH